MADERNGTERHRIYVFENYKLLTNVPWVNGGQLRVGEEVELAVDGKKTLFRVDRIIEDFEARNLYAAVTEVYGGNELLDRLRSIVREVTAS